MVGAGLSALREFRIPSTSIEDVFDVVRAKAAETPKGEWLRGATSGSPTSSSRRRGGPPWRHRRRVEIGEGTTFIFEIPTETSDTP